MQVHFLAHDLEVSQQDSANPRYDITAAASISLKSTAAGRSTGEEMFLSCMQTVVGSLTSACMCERTFYKLKSQI